MQNAFTARPQTLAAAVTWAAKWLPAKPVVPVQAGLKLDVADGRLTVTAMNEHVTGRAVIELERDLTGDAEGTALVSGRLLAELVKTFPDKAVAMVVEGEQLVVTAGRFRVGLPLMAVEDYPALPGTVPAIGTVAGGGLADAVTRVGAAAGHDLGQVAALVTMRLGFGPGGIELMATDRYRAAREVLPWQGGGEPCAAFAMGMVDVAQACAGPDEVVVGYTPSLLSFTTPTRSITVTQVAVEGYPEDQLRKQILPDPSAGAVLAVKDMALPLKRAALVKAKDAPIDLTFDAGTITVSAAADDIKQASDDEVACEYDGPAETITVKPNYLADALAAVPGDTARIGFEPGKYSPIVITAPGDAAYRHVIMPIRKR